jgi:FlaA1/EpsC-like NDP-sugar epimerase
MRDLLPREHGVVRFLGALALDAAIIAASYAIALLLRFDNNVPQITWDTFVRVLPLIVLAYLATFILLGVYRTAWQYGGIPDIVNLGRGVALMTAAVFLYNLTNERRDIPLSVNLISGALVFISSSFIKMAPRLFAHGHPLRRRDHGAKRLLIVGAGDTGQFVAREFRSHPAWGYRPVCFVDDDRRKRGLRVVGVPVAGGTDDLPALVRRFDVDVVALAFPSAPGARVREIVTLCGDAGVPVRMVPGLPEIVRHPGQTPQLREITVEDLIGREPVDIDYSECLESIRGKVVLVTGAAGSIGSELVRQVRSFHPAELHVLDINETGLHDLRLDLTSDSPEDGPAPITWIADIADAAKLRRVFEQTRPAIVFHAAAFKHVPMMEEHPDEALRVNIDGTRNVCRAAEEAGVEKVVFISTDKAINPTSVMGASKRIGELIVLAYAARARTTFCAVRFVNVIGSRGGVVDIFTRQIDRGGPVGVTHPDMQRYYVTIHEAVSLVIQAAAFAGQGQIYMLDIGEEIRTVDLAEKMIRMRGLTPGTDVPIVFTGVRPGEKLAEDLLAGDEAREPTHHPKVLRIVSAVRPVLGALDAEIATLHAAASDPAQLRRRLCTLAGADSTESRAPEPVEDRR